MGNSTVFRGATNMGRSESRARSQMRQRGAFLRHQATVLPDLGPSGRLGRPPTARFRSVVRVPRSRSPRPVSTPRPPTIYRAGTGASVSAERQALGQVQLRRDRERRPGHLFSYVATGMAVTDYPLYYVIRDNFRLAGNLAALDGAGIAAADEPNALTGHAALRTAPLGTASWPSPPRTQPAEAPGPPPARSPKRAG